MTLNDLLKKIPENRRDYIILIHVPQVRPGDEGDFPLIEITADDMRKQVILEGDV